MKFSEGQELALTQLKAIETESGFGFEIIEVGECLSNISYIEVNISINTRGIEKKPEGFLFRPRERFKLYIHSNFPYELPKISFYDFRFSGKPHVQWGKDICLYQSIESDYDPSDGIFGIIERLNFWLKQAALDDLDPTDAPLHPPVAYSFKENTPFVIPNANTPVFEEEHWLGACKLENLNEATYIISDWLKNEEVSTGYYAAVLLMNKTMPFEYPFTLDQLLYQLDKNNIDIKLFLENMGRIALKNGSGTPLFIVIGSPMRGYEQIRKQHLSVWYLEEKLARSLRTIYNVPVKSLRIQQKINSHIDKLRIFAQKSLLEWCKVLENRSEVIIERDFNTSSNFFKDKKIEIWGCGAIGSHLAEMIIRSKPKEIILVDNGIVKPGILTRQSFYENEIGMNKAEALKSRIEKIYQKIVSIKIEAMPINVLDRLNDTHNFNCDILIDSTASLRVFRKMDKYLVKNNTKIPVASIVINHNAKKAMAVVKLPNCNVGMFDLLRKAKLYLCEKRDRNWISDFFPLKKETNELIQPEPGCSDPTFSGSDTDLSALSGLILNHTNKAISNNYGKSKVIFISQELDKVDSLDFESIEFENYSSNSMLNDPINDYKIFIPSDILKKIEDEIIANEQKEGTLCETGGLLFGEWDELTKSLYINEISGPPSDSKSTPNHFECGIKGTVELNSELKLKYNNSVYFVGLWHSHPFGSTQFSSEDKLSMQLVVTELSPPKSLLLIIAYKERDFNYSGFVFEKSQFN